MASTYGAWLIALVLETIYFRFVQRFGILQGDLVWSDSVQLFANYLSAFEVQIFFATRVYLLTKKQTEVKGSLIGIFLVGLLAVLQLAAGTAQTVITYNLRSFSELDQTTAITTLQTAASLLCDVSITAHLCFYLDRNKTGLPTTERLLNGLMINAVNRGVLTATTSILTMCLFLAYPHSFWFFLSIAPNSKLYMNSLLATLNMRGHIWRKAHPENREWETINLGNLSRHETVSQVIFGELPNSADDTSHGDGSDTPKTYPSPDSSAYSAILYAPTFDCKRTPRPPTLGPDLPHPFSPHRRTPLVMASGRTRLMNKLPFCATFRVCWAKYHRQHYPTPPLLPFLAAVLLASCY
ncbi:hypothetical protein B0H16DRAFT_1736337 [Mycena metata]|uniref:DUF6534 domain-containing protein n=1 Tax=Mycena metata TaxID=1033252 RepID=A0AAD7MN24_9AGAR|nr:hypothetical protein B0H16DRAFT_1736337 [Mycena metata]